VRISYNNIAYPRWGYSQAMNEILFFAHIMILVSFVFIALKIGKEALVATFCIQVILANLFVLKQMSCFGLTVTCSEVYTIGSIFSMNLLQVYHGKKIANKALVTVFFLLFLVIVMSWFHLRYFPSEYDTAQEAFKVVLGSTPRIMFVSFICAFITQKIDMKLFRWISKKLPKASFMIPFILASFMSQFLDTALFSFGALYKIVHSMRDIIIMSFSIKMIITLCIAPLTLLMKKFIRHDPVQV